MTGSRRREHVWVGPDHPVGLRAPVKCCERGYLDPVHRPTWTMYANDPLGNDRARFLASR